MIYGVGVARKGANWDEKTAGSVSRASQAVRLPLTPKYMIARRDGWIHTIY